MKKCLVSVVVSLLIFLNGCFSYHDMNRMQFITMGILDYSEKDDKIIIYSENFVADRGTNSSELGVAKRVVLRGEGESSQDAFMEMQIRSGLPMSYSVNKALVITRRAAEQRFGGDLDLYERNQQSTNKQFVFVFDGEAEELLHIKLEDEMFTGIFLEEMMLFQGIQARVISIRLNEYLNNSQMGSKVSLLPMIYILKGVMGDRIEIRGAAVMLEDKMVDEITIDDVGTYKSLKNKIKTGNLSAQNPQDKGLISLQILKSKVKLDIDYDGKEATVNIKRNILVSTIGVQGKIDILDTDIKEKICKSAAERTEKRTMEFIKRFQEKGIDILDIETEVKRRYPKANVNDIIERTKFNIDITVEIDGSQYKTNNK